MIDHNKVKIVADTGYTDGDYAILYAIDEFSHDRTEVRGSFLKPTNKGIYFEVQDPTWYKVSDFPRTFDYFIFDTGRKDGMVSSENLHVNPYFSGTIH